ncbi:MAG: Holliday junction branch migration protein RuvA [Chloroflexota bacterium]
MISTLRGVLQRAAPGEIVLEVGGVGYQVAVPTSVLEQLPEVGQTLFLYTRMVVREDSLSLYGFESQEQRHLFDLLLQVGGVGPRLALAVLSHVSPELLRASVGNGQPEALTRVPGIGRKTAEKIIFYLRDKLEKAEGIRPALSGLDTEVLQALTSLGYSLGEAQAAVQSIPDDTPLDVEERVRHALRYFARP